ncbi:MAG TPA: ABC transporter permease [Bryobacteraceae bacterium]|nr:ABC transporter permease [Bryobacteraceae bacterium]
MHTLFQDIRYALRMLRKNLGLTMVIVLSLAIGIGANSAIFSVVDALLLRPLPYPQPNRLANVWLHSPGLGIFRDWPSPGEYIDLKTENHSFDAMAIAQLRTFTLTGRDQPERIDGITSASTLLQMLGAKPLLGRLLLPEEDTPGKAPVAILSHRVWQRLFNTDPQIVGKSITLNGKQYTVAGVMQPTFRLDSEVMPSEGPMDKIDVFLPLPLGADAVKRRGDENYNIMVHLKPGVSIQQAQADVDIIASRIREKDKRDRTFGMTVVGLQEQVVGDVRRAVLVLLGSVSLVLLIACANVANLLLTRATAREKEVAVRTALGADWKRLIRQLLTESTVLAVLGGTAGLLLARWTLFVVRTINPGNIPRLEDIEINGAVVAFTFGIAVVTGLLFGLAPAWRAMKLDLNTALKSGGRSGQSEAGFRLVRNPLRGLLVVMELALSLMLLVGAALLIRTFLHLQNVQPGFSSDHVITMMVALTGPKYKENKSVAQFFQEIGTRITRLPGVKTEGTVSTLPLSGTVGWGGISVEGYKPPPDQELQVDIRTASADYFRTMEIPLIKGRFFSEYDKIDSQQVAVIDSKFAERFWARDNPIGKHLWFDPKKPFTIVGVVATVKQYALDSDSKIAVYFPDQQQPDNGAFLVARTSTDPALLANPIVREIHAVDASVPVYSIRTMQERIEASLARQRFAAIMLGAFAAFAALLAAVGVYGVMSFLVSQNTHDIGLRTALGAHPADILGLIVRQGMGLAAIGIVIGLLGAWALTRVMASLLFGVTATDTFSFAVVALALAIVAFVATVVPAHRATRVDPLVALREE